MLFSLRSALLVLAALSASSVAPAQVRPGTEPLIASGSMRFPTAIAPSVLDPESNAKAAGELLKPAILTDGKDDAEPAAAKPVGDLSSMVQQMRSTEAGSRELECLAGAIYFESKSEPLKGQLAVGQVIANRSKSGRFPSSYCGVVLQPGQFSFVRGHALPSIPRTSLQWRTAVAVAKIVHAALQVSEAPRALFFHARRVSPNWHLTRLATIGNHVFYR